MMKKVLIANWKMNKTRRESLSFVSSLKKSDSVDVRIAAPYIWIVDLVESADVPIGTQNMSEYSHGAYTGEISCQMIKDAGAKFVILGHSERRYIMGESEEDVQAKVERAVLEGMPFVLCLGERAEDRENGSFEKVIYEQLKSAFDPTTFTADQLKNGMIAYEPVWAIGTGKSATLEEIDHVHTFIQDSMSELFDGDSLDMPILYGGSVNLTNIQEILSLPSVGGALIGGASLDVNVFNEMIIKIGESRW